LETWESGIKKKGPGIGGAPDQRGTAEKQEIQVLRGSESNM